MRDSSKKYNIRIRIWIDETSGPYLGIGRILLLKNIQETGSITNAAKRMNMSYRKAWQLVNDMNTRSNQPLVEKILGGKNGSGTIVTKEGERIIEEFFKLEKEIHEFVKLKSQELNL